MVRKRCNELATDITNYSIYEQMIPFTGRIPARQVLRNKPSPVGPKNLVCATANGIMVDFELFQGVGSFPDRGLGHGPSIVIRLVKHLQKQSHLYFDRYFITIPLLQKLLELGFIATGTIMANRLGKRINFPIGESINRGDSCQFLNNGTVAVK